MVNKGSPYVVKVEMAVPEAKNRSLAEATMPAGLLKETLGETHSEENHTSLE